MLPVGGAVLLMIAWQQAFSLGLPGALSFLSRALFKTPVGQASPHLLGRPTGEAILCG